VNLRTSDHDQWLAEVSSALADAERLTGLLADIGPDHALAMAVAHAEIMGLRQEVDRLRRDRAGERRREFDPKWLEYSAWTAIR